MTTGSGKVPMFRMRPHKGTLLSAVAVLLIGGLFFLDAHRDPGDIPAHERSNLVLMICFIIAGLLFIISTGRMWFKHLWHDRYR